MLQFAIATLLALQAASGSPNPAPPGTAPQSSAPQGVVPSTGAAPQGSGSTAAPSSDTTSEAPPAPLENTAGISREQVGPALGRDEPGGPPPWAVTSLYLDDDDARAVIAATAAQTGLPTDDPFRFGPDRLWAAIRESVDALPWIAGR